MGQDIRVLSFYSLFILKVIRSFVHNNIALSLLTKNICGFFTKLVFIYLISAELLCYTCVYLFRHERDISIVNTKLDTHVYLMKNVCVKKILSHKKYLPTAITP